MKRLQTVVFDIGADTTKIGFAGGQVPRSVFPTLVGSNKSNEVMIGGKNRDFFVGYEAQAKASLLNLRLPMDEGSVVSWDDMEKLWTHTFYDDLVIAPDESFVLMAEKTTVSRQSREKAMQIMFETFKVGGYYSVNQAVCGLLHLGRTTGVVWDAGHGPTFVVPIFEGYPLRHAIGKSLVGGRVLTDWMQRTFPDWRDDTAREMKERVCRVALDFQTECQRAEQGKLPAVVKRLKDGSEVQLHDETFRCGEGLFQPTIVGSVGEGIQQVINGALDKCDVDLRKECYSSIVVCGGTSMFAGLPERLEREIVALATPQMRVCVTATPERRNAVWLGGSVLGSLEAFPEMVVSRSQYQAEGVDCVHVVCG